MGVGKEGREWGTRRKSGERGAEWERKSWSNDLFRHHQWLEWVIVSGQLEKKGWERARELLALIKSRHNWQGQWRSKAEVSEEGKEKGGGINKDKFGRKKRRVIGMRKGEEGREKWWGSGMRKKEEIWSDHDQVFFLLLFYSFFSKTTRVLSVQTSLACVCFLCIDALVSFFLTHLLYHSHLCTSLLSLTLFLSGHTLNTKLVAV